MSSTPGRDCVPRLRNYRSRRQVDQARGGVFVLSTVKLLPALLLPAVLGYALLSLTTSPRRRAGPSMPGRICARLGTGFLLGYALLALLMWLDAKLFGTFHSGAIMLLLLSGGAALLWYMRRQLRDTRAESGPGASPEQRATHGAGTAIGGLFFALISLHLLLVAVEIAWRPVFPWDAWLNWMYRAKVWFFNDAMSAFSEPSLWLGGERPDDYNVAGAHYPPLLPLLTVWTADALGRWSETLINLPTLMLGPALALAVYGYCCRAGTGGVVALGAAAALLSTPLVGTHLALAGQTDIWLAGYSGVGLLALLHGLMAQRAHSLRLGLLLCLLGTTVKLDAWLWLTIAGTLILLRDRLRLAALAATAAFLLLAALSLFMPEAWLGGLAQKLPLVAGLEGQSALGRELGDDYLANYLLGDSWHLGGWLVALGALWALWQLRRGDDREASVLLAFTALQACVLLVVFNFSRHGAWADDWTAINRLPLQLLPAHCYLWARLSVRLLRGSAGQRPLWQPLLLALGLSVLLGAALLWGASGPAEDERRFAGASLRPMLGGGAPEGTALRLNRYANNIALASTGPISLDTTQLPLVELRTAGSSTQRVTFFWRDAASRELGRVAVGARGSALIDLRALVGDSTRISEAGVLAYADADSSALLVEHLHFLPASPRQVLRQHWLAWTQGSRWDQRSVHWTSVGASAPLSPVLAAVLLALMLALANGLIDRGRGPGRVLVPAFAVLWLLLDLRWLINLGVQAQATVNSYPLFQATAHAFSDDQRIAGAVSEALVLRARDTQRVAGPLLISAERRDLRYQMLRAKYHAVPTPVLVLEDWPPEAMREGDDLLLLRSSFGGSGASERSLAELSALIASRDLRAEIIAEDAGASLARIVQRAAR